VGSTLTVRIKTFAQFAEILGQEEFTLEIPAPATVADAIDALRGSGQGAASIPEHPLVAIDLKQVRGDYQLTDGQTLALMPPLAGG